jgi:hypothetical protein
MKENNYKDWWALVPVSQKAAFRAGYALRRYHITSNLITCERAWGLYASYYSVLVVRGIGYRILLNIGDLAANFPGLKDSKVGAEPWGLAGRRRRKVTIEQLLAEPIWQWAHLAYLGNADTIRTLTLAMGHAHDSTISMPEDTVLKQRKKNRKLVLSSPDVGVRM